MFQIPEEKLPDFAKDEQKVSVLFAPLRNRTVNPRDWDNKINCWKILISLYCKSNDVYSFTLQSMNKVFVRNGRPPVCLKDVLEQMLKDGDIIPLDKFDSKSPETWSGWATDVLIKRPLVWSFNKLKNSMFDPSDNITYVEISVINEKSTELFNLIPKDYLNKVINMNDLLSILKKDRSYSSSVKMLLHNLANQKKVFVHTSNIVDDETYMIKFTDKNTAAPINEMDIGIYSLEKNEKLLTETIEKLEDEIQSLIKQAKAQLAKGHKQSAKTCLRKKHEIEKRISKKADALHNIQVLVERIRDTHSDAHVWESYKLALESFNTTFKGTGLSEDAVEDTMIKLGEVLDIHDDIQTALSKPAKDTTASESDLEQELADLLKTEDKQEPSTDTIEAQLAKLHLSFPDLSDESKDNSQLEMSTA
ncbi:charged multivesicular body protein 7 [Aethina tumida]|uniref:charged multivesicular body protein 7 n=1 Tax=Aethina tumida TaxID=116153 RepID=UPI00214805A7|nr:charged multivesicular body protein 7 [Aethina tumida]